MVQTLYFCVLKTLLKVFSADHCWQAPLANQSFRSLVLFYSIFTNRSIFTAFAREEKRRAYYVIGMLKKSLAVFLCYYGVSDLDDQVHLAATNKNKKIKSAFI
jgi:hypothetical protein